MTVLKKCINGIYVFYCPGCSEKHLVWTEHKNHSGASWSFNGDMKKPTFSPSLMITWPNPKGTRICHSFVKEGNIQFLNDCTHELAGQTVPLPEIK